MQIHVEAEGKDCEMLSIKLFHSLMWVSGIKLRSSSLATSIVTPEPCCRPSPACAQCLARLVSEFLRLPVCLPHHPPLLSHVAMTGFYMDAGDLNSGPLASVTMILFTESSPQHSK